MQTLSLIVLLVIARAPGFSQISQSRQGPDSRTANFLPSQDRRLFPLMVGDTAPALMIGRWVKGSPTKDFAKGRVYVIEFWATWCGPCLAGMAHLTRIQNQYGKDRISVIGVTSRDEYGNTLEAVQDLVAKKGKQIGYTIAWDAESGSKEAYQGVFKGKTTEAYLRDAHIPAIPCSFVVDRQGLVAYIGHPMTLDKILPSVIDGSWNVSDAARKYRAAREAEPMLDQFTELLKASKYDEAYALARMLMANQVKDDVRGLLIIADAIAGDESQVTQKDLPLSLQAAVRANELTDYGDPGLVATLASVYFFMGDHNKAIEIQTRATSISEGGMKAALQKILDRYKSTAKPQ